MNKSFSLFRLLAVLAIVATTTLTSCNRGYGCNTNFGLNEVPEKCVTVEQDDC